MHVTKNASSWFFLKQKTASLSSGSVSYIAVFKNLRGLHDCQLKKPSHPARGPPGDYLICLPPLDAPRLCRYNFGPGFANWSGNPNSAHIKSFLGFFLLPSPLFCASSQSSFFPSALGTTLLLSVPALVGTWQPQWKAAGGTVLKNEVNNLSEHLGPCSLFISAPPTIIFISPPWSFYFHPPTRA